MSPQGQINLWLKSLTLVHWKRYFIEQYCKLLHDDESKPRSRQVFQFESPNFWPEGWQIWRKNPRCSTKHFQKQESLHLTNALFQDPVENLCPKEHSCHWSETCQKSSEMNLINFIRFLCKSIRFDTIEFIFWLFSINTDTIRLNILNFVMDKYAFYLCT